MPTHTSNTPYTAPRSMRVWLWLLFPLFLFSCQKWEDKPGPTDPRLARKYCNDPEAVNFNWDFPGTPDASVCLYPSDVFVGDYQFYDTAYNDADSPISTQIIAAQFTGIDRTRFELSQFCNSAPLQLTATRYFTATIDTLLPHGQTFCRIIDTVSGIFSQKGKDTLSYQWAVWSDTAVNTHRGRAYRQP